jgi:hypothetical protein
MLLILSRSYLKFKYTHLIERRQIRSASLIPRIRKLRTHSLILFSLGSSYFFTCYLIQISSAKSSSLLHFFLLVEDSGAPSRSIQALSLHGLEGVYTRRRGGPIAIAAVVGVGTRRVPFARGITSGSASNGGGNSTGAGSVSGSSVHNNNNSSNSGRSQATTTTVTQESDKVSRNQRR